MLEKQTSGRTIGALSGRAGQKGTNMDQGMVALALGIAASATDHDITERASALRGIESKLKEATGKATSGEAFAVIDAWKDSASKLLTVQGELAKVQAVEEQRAYSAEVEKARAEGKIVPGNEAKVLATYKTAKDLAAWRETVIAALPGAQGANEKQPANAGNKSDESASAAPTWRGKTWSQLSYSERAALANEDKALFAEMRGAAKGEK
jgi:hypothetical protein